MNDIGECFYEAAKRSLSDTKPKQLVAMAVSVAGASMVYAAAFRGSRRLTIGGLALAMIGGFVYVHYCNTGNASC